MKIISRLVAVIAVLLVSITTFEVSNAQADDNDLKNNAIASATLVDAKASEFWSYWGAALIADYYPGKRQPIKSASIVNGVVRAEEEDRTKDGIGLEVHRFITGGTWRRRDNYWGGSFATGPYVSTLFGGSDRLIDALGLGWMLGLAGGRHFSAKDHPSPEEEKAAIQDSKVSMNFGVGYFISPGVRVLANGFKDGEAPPNGETDVRYKTVTLGGLQVLVSFSYTF